MTYLDPIDHMELALVVHIGDITRPEPSIGRLSLLRGLWIPPVTLHNILRAYPQLSSLISLHDLSDAVFSHDFRLAVSIRLSDGC
jgi:hypothetical protein